MEGYPTCDCDECRDMCKRPCWPTVDEAQAIIDAGYGDYLMSDYHDPGDRETVYILCGRLKDHDKFSAPDWPSSEAGCVFQVDGLCLLHDDGLKPLEGRAALCDAKAARFPNYYADYRKTREAIIDDWDTPKGRELIAWAEVQFGDPD